MKNNFFKNFIIIVVTFSILLVCGQVVEAKDLTITFTDEDCSITPFEAPLFEATDMKPLYRVFQEVTAVNDGGQAASLEISLKDSGFLDRFFDSDPSLAEVLRVTITEVETNTVVYGPRTIFDWRNDGYIVLSPSIPSGETRHYDFKLEMDDVGNEYQKKVLSFDAYLNCMGFGEVEGDTDIRTPVERIEQVLGEITERLPDTGETLLSLVPSLIFLGMALSFRKKNQ